MKPTVFLPADWVRVNEERAWIMTGSWQGVDARGKLLLLDFHQRTLELWEPFVLRDDEVSAYNIGEERTELVTLCINRLIEAGWLAQSREQQLDRPSSRPLRFLARGPALQAELDILHNGPHGHGWGPVGLTNNSPL